jgi:hypothetical protein
MGEALVKLTREAAREGFASAGLSYADLDLVALRRLRVLINREMIGSGLMKSSYRCYRGVVLQNAGTDRFFAGIRCSAFYFERREAVSFNRDGFIGFAGWSDDTNVQPILRGFLAWIGEMKKARGVVGDV